MMLPWPAGAAAPILDWLSTWPLYPQCYWQNQNGSEEVARCWVVRYFTRLSDVQRFLVAQPTARDLQIWGLKAYGGAAQATLPPMTAGVTGVTHLPDLPEWRCIVEQAPAQFLQGKLEKVVLARRYVLSVDIPPAPLLLMAASRQALWRYQIMQSTLVGEKTAGIIAR